MIKKILVAGSGANGMLLTGTLDDMEQWKEINVEKYQWITMAIGGMFSMAIDQHGNLHLWGNFNSKIIQNPIVFEMPTACRIWCGWEHGIILTTDGNLYGIGCNKYNQLSSSKKQYFVEPELILSKTDVSDAFCGFRQTFIVADRILGCGSNRSGELGNGKLNTDGWIDIGKFNKIKKIQSSKKCLFILTEDGNLHIVGNNKIVPKLPQKIQEPTLFYEDVDDFACGWNHIVIYSSGQLRSYGSNTLGQLGHHQHTDIVDLPKDKYKLVSGTEFTFATGQDSIYGWGWNEHQNIAIQKQAIISKPIKIREGGHCLLTHSASTFLL